MYLKLGNLMDGDSKEAFTPTWIAVRFESKDYAGPLQVMLQIKEPEMKIETVRSAGTKMVNHWYVWL